MCQLGKVLEPIIHNISDDNPIEGYRGWYLKSDGYLYPLNMKLNQKYATDRVTTAILDVGENRIRLDGLSGFYCYNYNYNNNYNNYNYNNYNNYNNYYCIAGKCNQSGNLVKHELGYRSDRARPSMLVRLTPKDGLASSLQEFLEHFNSKVEACAKLYNIPVIDHVDFK